GRLPRLRPPRHTGRGAAAAGAEARVEEPVRFTVAASGDLLIHGPVHQRALLNGGGRRYDFRPMLRTVRGIVSPADLAICHLEVPLTNGTPSGWPSFRAPAELAEAIRWTGWDACSTASNHSLDGGDSLVRFTIRALNRQRVSHSGTSLSPRGRPWTMLGAKGRKVAFLAYVHPGIPGVVRPPQRYLLHFADAPRILADARAARRAGADAVIVSVHWGTEYVHEPSAAQRALASRLTRSPDVTAVIGQHVHVVQPVWRVNGKPVVFGEGNLLSNQTSACCVAASQDGMIALLDMEVGPAGARVRRVRYAPTWVRHPDFQVVRAPAESARRTAAVVESGGVARGAAGP
ncbi:MAG: CapA family protein, partial [Nocardioidaceae bacterium]